MKLKCNKSRKDDVDSDETVRSKSLCERTGQTTSSSDEEDAIDGRDSDNGLEERLRLLSSSTCARRMTVVRVRFNL